MNFRLSKQEKFEPELSRNFQMDFITIFSGYIQKIQVGKKMTGRIWPLKRL